MSCSSYSCLFLRQWAFEHVHLRLMSFCPNLLFLKSFATVFMYPLLSPSSTISSLNCVFLSPSLIIASIKLFSPALPTCWQTCFCCIWSGTVHLFLLVINPQKALIGLQCPWPLHLEPNNHSWYAWGHCRGIIGASYTYKQQGGLVQELDQCQRSLYSIPNPRPWQAEMPPQAAGQVGRQGLPFPTVRNVP